MGVCFSASVGSRCESGEGGTYRPGALSLPERRWQWGRRCPGSLPGEREFDLTPACQTDSQTSPPSILVPQQLLSVIRYCDSNGLQLHNRRGYAFCMVAALAALDLKQASHWFKVRVPVCPAPPALVTARHTFVRWRNMPLEVVCC